MDVIILYCCGINYIALHKRYKGGYDIIYIPIANPSGDGTGMTQSAPHVCGFDCVTLNLYGPRGPCLTKATLNEHEPVLGAAFKHVILKFDPPPVLL